MPPEILIAVKLPDPTMAALEADFICHKLFATEDRDQCLREVADKVRALVTTGLRGFDRALVEALPKLEFISVWGAGLQALDLDVAREKGIVVANTPDNSKIAVAELGMALLLAAARRIGEADGFVRSGHWESGRFGGLGTGLYGKQRPS